MDWHGFLIVRGSPARRPPCSWATRVTIPNGALYELAGTGDPASLGRCLPDGDRVEATDHGRGAYRMAVLNDGRLAGALFVTRTGKLPPRDWLISQLDEPVGPAVLAARPPANEPDKGAIVCVCFDIGMKTIIGTIAGQRLTTVAEIGQALRAGTNCGSCRPALARILADIPNGPSRPPEKAAHG